MKLVRNPIFLSGLALVLLGAGAIAYIWNGCRSLRVIFNYPQLQLERITFRGQRRLLQISDPKLLEYFSKCFAHRVIGKDKPGTAYHLTISARSLQTTHTDVYLSPENDGLSVAMQTLSTEIGLDDSRLIFVPLLEPHPPELRKILLFLQSTNDVGKHLVLDGN